MDLLAQRPQLTTHPVDVGQRSEGAILAALLRRGFHVLLPFGVNQRYDLVIELNGKFIRAQCKTGRLRNGSIVFPTKSTRSNNRRCVSRGYDGEVDVFLVYCNATEGVYVVPVERASTGYMHLRIHPAVNGQDRRINWARDFELPA
jgi:PD-(D/E)XK endonuclease